MLLALKLLASGVLDAVPRGLSAALKWLLADWRNVVVGTVLPAFAWMALVTAPGLRADLAETAASLAAEQVAHLRTVNSFRAASRQAQQEAEANALRVARQQEIVTHETLANLRNDRAALRARFVRLRDTARRTPVYPGRADPAGLSGPAGAAGRAAATSADQDLRPAGNLSPQPACPIGLVCLSIDEAEAASEDAHRHNRLIDWVIAQSAVRFTRETSRDE
ncbi:MAG: hypothetical protein WC692_07495 [Erythrobacter sp.]|jgi:hypothetical protein